MDYVSVKNFDKLQHYSVVKTPTWIKLYTSILDDYELSLLPEQARLIYVLLLPLAAMLGNKISTDRRWLAERLHLPELRRESVTELLKAGFLLPFDPSAQTEVAEPVAEEEANPADTDQPSEQSTPLSLVPAEPVGKPKKSKKKSSIDVNAILKNPLFLQFWGIWPRKDARLRAAADWGKLVGEGVITEATLPLMIATIERNLKNGTWRVSEPQYIPLPSTWLNGRRWEDEGSAPAAGTGNAPDAPKERPPLKLAL